jgi:hypothetical protein
MNSLKEIEKIYIKAHSAPDFILILTMPKTMPSQRRVMLLGFLIPMKKFKRQIKMLPPSFGTWALARHFSAVQVLSDVVGVSTMLVKSFL